MLAPNLLSATPNVIFDILPTLGTLVSKKICRLSGNTPMNVIIKNLMKPGYTADGHQIFYCFVPSEMQLMDSNASTDVLKGANANSSTILVKRCKSRTDFSTCANSEPISSNSLTLNSVKPVACS